jgi:hypothetical protein
MYDLLTNHPERRSQESISRCGGVQEIKGSLPVGHSRRRVEELLIRNEDVQVVCGFDTVENGKGFLSSRLFNSDVVVALKPHLEGNPDVRIYETAD